MFRRILLGLAAALLVFVGVVAMRPSSFEVSRSARVNAPADVVYRHIENLRAMDMWSPYAHMDPQLKLAYDGPESGVGARSSWVGPQMGTGSLTVTRAVRDREVEMSLDMLTPMEAHNRILFTLAPKDGATEVTWRMQGRSGFLGKAIGLFVNMDGMVGGQFEEGLASLQKVAENDAVALAGDRASSR
jgi:polyketide cyclase/dehydrase/lipid transport protein